MTEIDAARAEAVPQYELVDKDGTVVATNVSAHVLGLTAKHFWPDQQLRRTVDRLKDITWFGFFSIRQAKTFAH